MVRIIKRRVGGTPKNNPGKITILPPKKRTTKQKQNQLLDSPPPHLTAGGASYYYPPGPPKHSTVQPSGPPRDDVLIALGDVGQLGQLQLLQEAACAISRAKQYSQFQTPDGKEWRRLYANPAGGEFLRWVRWPRGVRNGRVPRRMPPRHPDASGYDRDYDGDWGAGGGLGYYYSDDQYMEDHWVVKAPPVIEEIKKEPQDDAATVTSIHANPPEGSGLGSWSGGPRGSGNGDDNGGGTGRENGGSTEGPPSGSPSNGRDSGGSGAVAIPSFPLDVFPGLDPGRVNTNTSLDKPQDSHPEDTTQTTKPPTIQQNGLGRFTDEAEQDENPFLEGTDDEGDDSEPFSDDVSLPPGDSETHEFIKREEPPTPRASTEQRGQTPAPAQNIEQSLPVKDPETGPVSYPTLPQVPDTSIQQPEEPTLPASSGNVSYPTLPTSYSQWNPQAGEDEPTDEERIQAQLEREAEVDYDDGSDVTEEIEIDEEDEEEYGYGEGEDSKRYSNAGGRTDEMDTEEGWPEEPEVQEKRTPGTWSFGDLFKFRR